MFCGRLEKIQKLKSHCKILQNLSDQIKQLKFLVRNLNDKVDSIIEEINTKKEVIKKNKTTQTEDFIPTVKKKDFIFQTPIKISLT